MGVTGFINISCCGVKCSIVPYYNKQKSNELRGLRLLSF